MGILTYNCIKCGIESKHRDTDRFLGCSSCGEAAMVYEEPLRPLPKDATFVEIAEGKGEFIKGQVEPPCIIAVGFEPGAAYRFEEHRTGRTFYGTADGDGKVKAVEAA